MSDPDAAAPSPSAVDGDGVRVTVLPAPAPAWVRAWPVLALLLVAGLVLVMVLPAPPAQKVRPVVGMPASTASDPDMHKVDAPSSPAAIARAAEPAVRPLPAVDADPVDPVPGPQRDPDDLAHYIRPGDPEPTGAELIQALRDAGEREGIAAFNPPGTSPPLAGLAVPADFNLPPGYVRHHQVTDQGEPIEPILMYAPDAVIHDAAGRLVAIPDDRIVPPERAPPGLPIRQVEIPVP